MNTNNLSICVMDIETYNSIFLYCGYDIKTKSRFQYEVSYRKVEIDGLVKHLTDSIYDYYCTFNGVSFDGQVLQFILDNHEKWYNWTYRQILDAIYEFSQELISNQNYDVQSPYKEHYLDFKQIDLYKILGYDNENKRCGLKWAFGFSLDGDIEELPHDHRAEYLTSEEIDDVIRYCWKDVMNTYNGYKLCIGDTEHEEYKGKNKVQMRLDLIQEYNLSHTAINWSDIKIGAELNKKAYMELTGISTKHLWDKIKSRKTKKDFKFRDCFPSYIKFETEEFRNFIKMVGSTKVDLWKKQEFPFTYNDTTYTFAKGGGHSCDKPRIIKPNVNQLLIDADVGSMYPNIIRKRNLYPAHLGPEWNKGYVLNIPRRLASKKKYKETKEKKHESLAEAYKCVLNGSFGKLIERTDWQYDPFIGISVTVGGQIDIFMLAEDIEQIPTAHVVSMNTDGLTVVIDEQYIQEYYRVCREWEIQVGNDEIGNLEYVEYELLAQTSVNDYIAVKKADWVYKDDKFTSVSIDKPISERLKKKGDFLTSYELHKNKSKRIVPIALEKYITERVPVIDTIKAHRNLYDFGIAKKASKDYFYRLIDRKTGKFRDMNRLIRYYCSKEKGDKIFKFKYEHSEKTGPVKSVVESTSQYQILFNSSIETDKWEELDIDYKYYEDCCDKILFKLDPEYKRKRLIQTKRQIVMFD